MDEWLIALAGGAVGAVVAALVAQAGRAWRAWSEIELHDGEAEERNRQLVVWVDDRTRALVQEMERRTNSYAARGMNIYHGAHGAHVAEAKTEALHEYRDQEWAARLDLARLRAREGGWHAIWRRVRTRAAPSLTARAKVEPFLDRWREAVTRHGGETTPLDRTTRTTADALAELPSLKLT